jgi:hypothetical protein
MSFASRTRGGGFLPPSTGTRLIDLIKTTATANKVDGKLKPSLGHIVRPCLKKQNPAKLMPVILATLEAEIKRITV